jgi:hypothetical protein
VSYVPFCDVAGILIFDPGPRVRNGGVTDRVNALRRPRRGDEPRGGAEVDQASRALSTCVCLLNVRICELFQWDTSRGIRDRRLT